TTTTSTTTTFSSITTIHTQFRFPTVPPSSTTQLQWIERATAAHCPGDDGPSTGPDDGWDICVRYPSHAGDICVRYSSHAGDICVRYQLQAVIPGGCRYSAHQRAHTAMAMRNSAGPSGREVSGARDRCRHRCVRDAGGCRYSARRRA